MSIDTINELIGELEQGETSLSNIRNLSALYTVKAHILGSNVNVDRTEKELRDILPSYLQYIEIKRKYQLKETTVDALCTALNSLCSEINEFLHTLYSCTDSEQERAILKRITLYK